MNVFEGVAFPVFFVSFCFGILAGYILHAIARAPRWLVDRLSE